MWPDGEGAVGVKPEGGARASTSSDVEVFDERSLPAAGLPNIAQLNVTKSSGVHFGPKFVKVTQNVHNTEVVKGRFLGLELITPKKGNRLRCSVAVFVCWAAVVVTGLAFYLFKYILAVPPTRLDLGIKELWYVRRDDWQAMPEYKMTFHKLPLTYVLIGHSATNYCDEKYACIKQVLGIQSDHLRRGWDDIGPNFLVSGDGLVFEGRGANLIGAMVKYWNSKSITIMFLGDYSQETTRPEQFEHVAALLEVLVTKGVLIKDFIVYGHCQVAPLIITPGKNIMDNIHLLPHWNPANTTGYLPFHKYIWNLIKTSSTIERLSCAAALLFLGVLIGLIIFFTLTPEKVSDIEDRGPENWNITRTMWLAKPFQTNETTTPFEPLRLVVIQHTVSQECHRFIVCAAELRNLQGYFLKKYEYDIPYNFLVGNDGRVYEGRGWEKVGAHTRFYNRCSLGIGFIGDYREELPAHSSATELQMTRLKKLLSLGVSLGYIHPQYHVLAAKDIQETASPGSNLYRILQQWSHYDNGTNFVNKTCEDMYANFHEDG